MPFFGLGSKRFFGTSVSTAGKLSSVLLHPAEAEYVFSVLPASRWQGHGREVDRRVVAAFLCDRLPFRRQDAGGTLNAYEAGC